MKNENNWMWPVAYGLAIMFICLGIGGCMLLGSSSIRYDNTKEVQK